MNREIKFEYGFRSVNGIVKKVYHLHEIPLIRQKCDVWNDLPIVYVREYTGLKDKNGVEIYEGDILLVDDRRTVKVVWHQYASSFDTEFINDKLPNHTFNSLRNCNWHLRTEVISNIHQNHELIESK